MQQSTPITFRWCVLCQSADTLNQHVTEIVTGYENYGMIAAACSFCESCAGCAVYMRARACVDGNSDITDLTERDLKKYIGDRAVSIMRKVSTRVEVPCDPYEPVEKPV